MDLKNYNKQTGDSLRADEWNSLLTDIETGVNGLSMEAPVTDVQVDGTSIVEGGIANIVLQELKDVIAKSMASSKFYVNNVLVEPVNGIINLASGSEYTLRGDLTGKITIGSEADTPETYTYLRLNGVNINSDDSTVIQYLPADKGVEIYLCPDSINEVVCHKVEVKTDDQLGAIHSNNNLRLFGFGYLIAVNPGGHGIKASKILTGGKPRVYIEAEHDGIHAGSRLDLYGDGVYYFEKCHDAFGTGDTGVINEFLNLVSGGAIFINVLTDSGFVFNYKSGKLVTNMATKVDLVNAVTKPSSITQVISNDNAFYPWGETLFATYKEDSDISYSITGVALDASDNELGELSITETDSVITIAEPEGGITGTVDKYVVTVSGYISGKRITTALKKVDMILNNAYINSTDTTYAAIEYTSDSSRLKITANEGDNIILSDNATNAETGKGNGAVYSANNLVFESKAGASLFIEGDAVGVAGSTISIRDSAGVLAVAGNTYGICGTEVFVGSDDATENITDYFEGYLEVQANTIPIYARLSSKQKKGTFTIQSPMKGALNLDRVKAANLVSILDTDYLGGGDAYTDTTGTIELPTNLVADFPYTVCRYRKAPLKKSLPE